jgi:hypothetical protein
MMSKLFVDIIFPYPLDPNKTSQDVALDESGKILNYLLPGSYLLTLALLKVTSGVCTYSAIYEYPLLSEDADLIVNYRRDLICDSSKTKVVGSVNYIIDIDYQWRAPGLPMGLISGQGFDQAARHLAGLDSDKECDHNYVWYRGFSDSYEYCEKCDIKK